MSRRQRSSRLGSLPVAAVLTLQLSEERVPTTAVVTCSISGYELALLNYLYCFQNVELPARDTEVKFSYGLYEKHCCVILDSKFI